MASSPSARESPVVVLGAGLTGLSAALELTRMEVPHRVFEKLACAGGHAVTTLDSGFRFDRTGHLLHLRDDGLRSEVLGWLEGDCREIARKSVIWSNGVYTRYPFQANTFGLPPDVAHECVLGFIEAHFDKTRVEPKNFEEFCLKHFGTGFTRHFMLPYNGRLWGVAPSEITSAWCQRFVPLPKLEDVIAGAVGKNDRELGYNQRFLYPRFGIGELPRALERRLRTLELARAPSRIDLRARHAVFENETVPFDVLLSTIPLPVLIDLLDPVPEEVRAARAKLRATHLYYLDVALARPPRKDFHWAYVPEERYPFYRVGCYTHFSPELAPPGQGSLYVELASRDEPDLARLLPEVVRGLIEMGLLGSGADVVFARVRRIDFAYVIFDHAYYSALAVIEPFLREQRVVSTGRYGSWQYSSMEDALLMGRAGASRAAALLRGEDSET